MKRKEYELSSYIKDIEYLSDVSYKLSLIKKTVDILCDSLLLRAKDDDEDPLWKSFYHIQMLSYIKRKKSFIVKESEGDMIYDLIKATWLELKSYMENSCFGPINNFESYFRTINIDFPIDNFDLFIP